MDRETRTKISAMFDHRRLNRSGSSLFTAFIISVIALIVIATASNLSIPSRDFSEVKIEIKTVVPHLPLSSEEENAGKYPIKQQTQMMMLPSPKLNITMNDQLQVIQIFRQSNMSDKFDQRVRDFMSNGCEVNFIMTWISPAELFGRRELLAVESVFKSHQHGCLMILSATMDSPHGYRTLRPFLDQGYKVLAVTPDLSFLLKGTPGESWLEEIETRNRDPGKISLAQNLSNLLRLAALYKYGGVYLDTDMIVLRSFRGLRNVIGAQTLAPSSRNWTRLNNAVLIFDKNHPLLLKFIQEFAVTFNGNIWGHNGPYLVSRVARAIEGTEGYNFTVLPPSAFYPVNWLEIDKFFHVPKSERDDKWVKAKLIQMQSKSYGLHLWNKFSKKLEMEEGSAIRGLVSDRCIICRDVQW